MRILAIESSCDETSASVITNQNGFIEVLSNITATSLSIHATTGGIIPEDAAREQLKCILPVITEALLVSKDLKPDDNSWDTARKILIEDIDAIAITYGPGLIASLLVGVETAKTLAYVFDKPLIPVNHLLGHIYANFIQATKNQKLKANFPFIGLIVSGAHTDLLYFKSHTEYTWLGGSRDDAAGEAFDKIGRLLNFPYPAGAEIEKRASKVISPTVEFQSPLIYSKDFDFSFSGLKSEVMRFVTASPERSEGTVNQICFATQKAIIDVLVKKTLKATEKYNCKTVLIGGGVSANQTLIDQFKLNAKRSALNPQIFSPEKIYCTDNAAMIGAYALLNPNMRLWKEVNANPELYFS